MRISTLYKIHLKTIIRKFKNLVEISKRKIYVSQDCEHVLALIVVISCINYTASAQFVMVSTVLHERAYEM